MPFPGEDIFQLGLDLSSTVPIQLFTGKDISPWENAYRGMWFPAFRQYNEAINAWLKGITLQKSSADGIRPEVRVMHSSPERAYSKFIAPLVEGRVDIPILVFHCTGTTFQQSRRYLPSNINFTKVNMGDYWIQRPKSLPYDLSYQISAWTKHYWDADQIDWHILSRFQPFSYIYANGGLSRMKLMNMSDNTDLEPGDNKERIIHRDYMLTVEAWCPLPFTETGIIDNIRIQTIINSVNNESIISGQDPDLILE